MTPDTAVPLESPEDLKALMLRMRNGDDRAVVEFLDIYGHHVLAAVRRRLDRRQRSRLDSNDITQSVWGSFFRHPDNLQRFDDSGQLVQFLIRLAQYKVSQHHRRNWRDKRDIRREQSLEETIDTGEERLPCDTRTPSRIAAAREHLARLFRAQPVSHQDILCRRATGETVQAIAQALGLHVRTVYKILEHAKAWPV